MQSHKQKLGQFRSFLTDAPTSNVETKGASLEKKTPDEIIPNLFLGNGTHGNDYLKQ
jgi:hypothetical protein